MVVGVEVLEEVIGEAEVEVVAAHDLEIGHVEVVVILILDGEMLVISVRLLKVVGEVGAVVLEETEEVAETITVGVVIEDMGVVGTGTVTGDMTEIEGVTETEMEEEMVMVEEVQSTLAGEVVDMEMIDLGRTDYFTP